MATTSAPITPELLAPAGDWDCVRAAVENGADAIYLGLDCGFNARARAKNFSVDDLPRLMRTVHPRGVKAYVTLNTLVFTEELAHSELLIRQLATAGVDAVLVQDLGVARLIRAVCPDLPIHASTQMTLTSAECIHAIADLGIERVVLPRELSVREIRAIRAHTSVGLEVFVHGALCVAYSGQCLTSESLGGRSANRGQCAQACRLPYELVCDDRDVELGEVRYLLSPQDLAGYALIPDLLAAGVSSFKIEGRLKSAEYVANITAHYRRALDSAMANQTAPFTPTQIEEMELSFSRGFSVGWLQGCDHKMLVPGLSSDKRGVLLGEVTATHSRHVTVRLATRVARGDGVLFAANQQQPREQGGRIFQILRRGQPVDGAVSSGEVELLFDAESVQVSLLHPGQQVWKTDDPQLTNRLRKSFSGPDPRRRVPLDVQVTASVGDPLRIVAQAATGLECVIQSADPLDQARKHPLTEALLREQLGRLGGTIYQLRHLAVEIHGQPMVPLSVFGQLRRQLVQNLDDQSSRLRPRSLSTTDPVLPNLRASRALAPHSATDVSPRLRVLCRSWNQLQAMPVGQVASAYADFQDIRQYRNAVSWAREKSLELYLATPRIQKPGEMGIFRALARHQPAGVLARNLAGIKFFHDQGIPVVADFSLNAANELTVDYLLHVGAGRVTPSYDLNRQQLLDLTATVACDGLEAVVHQHMPMFHMEHCVFCAVLSPGTNKTNCGRPCDEHRVELRDRTGVQHPLHADVGCRNTLFNAVPQSAAEVIPELVHRGLRDFRIELMNEGPAEILALVESYRALLAGRVSGASVWQQLRALNRVGVTRGTLEERRDPLAII